MPGKWAWRGVGFSGGFVPLIGDAILVPVVRKLAPLSASPFITQGARLSIAGSTIGAGMEYHKRWGLHHFAARTLESFSLGAIKAPAEAWESSPAQSYAGFWAPDFQTSTTRVGSFKSGGPRPSSSRTGRKAPLARPRKQRCRKMYRGKRCKLSLGHRGRHSY